MTIALDYETFSSVDLPERGLDNYVKSPDFRILLASVYGKFGTYTFDFVFNTWYEKGQEPLQDQDIPAQYKRFLYAEDDVIIAHSSGFERAVTEWFSQSFQGRWRDSAVLARMLGAESKLEVASRQLTNSHKLEVGNKLVMRFCVPNELYPEGATAERIIENDDMDNWMLFIEYCEMDAQGSYDINELAEKIFSEFAPGEIEKEDVFENVTYEMNSNGWHVDVPLVEKMKQRAWANGIISQKVFVTDTGAQINFNSYKQLQEFCADRGFPVKSLDKYHLPLALEKIDKKIIERAEFLATEAGSNIIQMRETSKTWVRDFGLSSEDTVLKGYREVKALLETKQEIGGSTLSKLPKILDLSGDDDQLRDQYMHVGAGQTYRTTGKGVQMQNLGKLKMMKDEDGKEYVKDVSTIYDLSTDWSNGDMAGQLRQVFTSRSEGGELIVGDFSAVESRGLAYLAGEEWKLDAYREGLDVYKVLVTKYDGISYEEVTPALRPRGKYSELSCGYQASGKAVQDFMFRLGFDVSIEEALQNVSDWRQANPNIVDFWYLLDKVLKDAVRKNRVMERKIGHDLSVRISPFTLESMQEQHPGSVSLVIQILLPNGRAYVTRVVHGCYFRKNGDSESLCYYKPVDRLRPDGRLWTATYKHPKTKRLTYYSIYGGKLAGILTQSMCREMFFESLEELNEALKECPNAEIVGQFHDEIAVDWWPEEGGWDKERVIEIMDFCMSTTLLTDFPLVADIKSDYRYIK